MLPAGKKRGIKVKWGSDPDPPPIWTKDRATTGLISRTRVGLKQGWTSSLSQPALGTDLGLRPEWVHELCLAMPGVASSTHVNLFVLHDKPQNRHDNPVLLDERRVNQPGILSCLHLEWTKNRECKRARPLTLPSTRVLTHWQKNKWTCYCKVWKSTWSLIGKSIFLLRFKILNCDKCRIIKKKWLKKFSWCFRFGNNLTPEVILKKNSKIKRWTYWIYNPFRHRNHLEKKANWPPSRKTKKFARITKVHKVKEERQPGKV